jgi:hypothetical protein
VRVLEAPQGTREWLMARLGIPTASMFGKIITPGLKPSASAEGYMHRLLAEWMIGEPLDDVSSDWMARGTDLEQRAVAFYELERGTDVHRVGFCLHDNGLVGCSPDGLVGDDGGLEIKVPSAAVHVSYLLGESVPPKYMAQVQGSLWVTKRQWWDFLSYNPAMPPALVRTYPDDKWQAALDSAIPAFIEVMMKHRQRLVKLGYVEAERVAQVS